MKTFFFRLLIFGICAFLSWWGTADPVLTNYPAAASPFLFLVRIAAGSLVLYAAIVPLILICASFLKKRFFCRYCCPMGCSFDLIRSGSKKILGRKTNRVFRFFWSGKIILLIVLIGSIFAVPVLTRWILFDPLLLFQGIFRSGNGIIWGAIALLIAEGIFPRIWCGNVCPLGALQDILFRLRKVLVRGKRSDSDLIEDLAVRSDPQKTEAEPRRLFLYSAAVSIYSVLILTPLTTVFGSGTKRLRPPGAVAEPRFSSLCSSCGRCISACPNGHLIPIGFGSSAKEEDGKNPQSLFYNLTPTVEIEKSSCEKECIACGQVCPTGAIRPFDLKEKAHLQTGIAVYNFDHCVLYMEKECNICIRECPWDAISSVWSDDLMIGLPTVDPKKCTGCGRCVAECPGFDPIYYGEESEDGTVQGAPPPPKAFTIQIREPNA
ncbi:MAG: 4Fe-4S binding protein [Planctomycetia bacterium]|nr:4Fe-4S binding protein [Planctomycetia bacterium]